MIEYYSSKKKDKILSFATRLMKLKNIILNGISKIHKNDYHMFSFICEDKNANLNTE
jgi:RNA:NAD 2'-phosphotransferase (TPT1/KptA family)